MLYKRMAKRLRFNCNDRDDRLEDDYFRFQWSAYDANCFDEPRIDRMFLDDAEERLRKAAVSKYERLCGFRGTRYAGNTFESYDAESEGQQKAVASLIAYATDEKHVQGGEGVILFGPRGTGKDHLMMALSRLVILRFGFGVEWINGLDLYGKFRDSFNDGSRQTEAEIIRSFITPDVLYISDPLPPSGALTEFQMAQLFRVLDARYSNCRATWITVNVTGGEELDKRLGPQNGDRLRDNALAIFCNWPSHRKVGSLVKGG